MFEDHTETMHLMVEQAKSVAAKIPLRKRDAWGLKDHYKNGYHKEIDPAMERRYDKAVFKLQRDIEMSGHYVPRGEEGFKGVGSAGDYVNC